MKTYVMTTGTIFGLVVVAHVWRAVEEGAGVTRDPFFLAITALALGLGLWALRVLRTVPRS